MPGARAVHALVVPRSRNGMADSRADCEGPADAGEAGPPEAAEAVARDIQLVRRVQAGDKEAYGELVRRHMRRAFSIAFSILRHREDAEDVVQDAFVRILERIDRIEDGRPFHPWLYRVVANLAISYGRARSVRTYSPLREDLLRAPGPAPDRAAELAELRERLLNALDMLPEEQRTIVVLADIEELNSREIGEILDMPSGTVRYHLHLARGTLRRVLSAEEEER